MVWVCYFKTHVWDFVKPCIRGENNRGKYMLRHSVLVIFNSNLCCVDNLPHTIGCNMFASMIILSFSSQNHTIHVTTETDTALQLSLVQYPMPVYHYNGLRYYNLENTVTL